MAIRNTGLKKSDRKSSKDCDPSQYHKACASSSTSDRQKRHKRCERGTGGRRRSDHRRSSTAGVWDDVSSRTKAFLCAGIGTFR